MPNTDSPWMIKELRARLSHWISRTLFFEAIKNETAANNAAANDRLIKACPTCPTS